MATLVLLSGGLDSAVLLYSLIAKGHEAHALWFDYAHRHGARERGAAERIAKAAGAKTFTIGRAASSGLFADCALTSPDVEIPAGRYDDPTMRKTVVPYRNLVMIAIGAAHAVRLRCKLLAIAAHAGDRAIYPDCRQEFLLHAAKAIACGHYEDDAVSLATPFVSLTKTEIVARGMTLRVPFADTWTCYAGLDKPCGACGACVERAEAFAANGIADPLLAACEASERAEPAPNAEAKHVEQASPPAAPQLADEPDRTPRAARAVRRVHPVE